MRRSQHRGPERGGALPVILAILGGLVLFGVVAVLAGLWFVKRHVQVEVERSGDVERVEVRTPFGTLEVKKADDIAQQLKLPLYPGAVLDKDESGSVRLQSSLGTAGGFNVTGGKFSSDDPYDSVEAWYRAQLGDFERHQGKVKGTPSRRGPNGWEIRVEPGGDDVLFTQDRKGRLRGVSLGREAGRTTILLFELYEARGQ